MPRLRPRRVGRKGQAAPLPLGARALAVVRSLPDRALLDRVVRGRTWIALLGIMLAGIVAMQVEVLKLGASEGRWINEGAALQSRNEILRASVATLSAQQRIERLAAQTGMVMPAADEVGFLAPSDGANATRAAANIHVPDAGTFLAALPADATASPTAPSSASIPGTGDSATGASAASTGLSAGGPDSATSTAATEAAPPATTDPTGSSSGTPSSATAPAEAGTTSPAAGSTSTATAPESGGGAPIGTPAG